MYGVCLMILVCLLFLCDVCFISVVMFDVFCDFEWFRMVFYLYDVFNVFVWIWCPEGHFRRNVWSNRCRFLAYALLIHHFGISGV